MFAGLRGSRGPFLRLLALALALANSPTPAAPARPRASQSQPPAPRHTLMPAPASVRILGGRMKVEQSFSVAYQGHADARLQAGVERALRRLERRTGLEFPRATAEAPAAANLVLQTGGPGRAVPSHEEDESYALEVSERQAFVNAPTVVGVLRGLETFLQLLTADAGGYYVPEARIKDGPRFAWRGLMIDACRHFEPVEVLKRNLDGMAAVKLNVFHWHLTDDQGFRVESRLFPELQRLGSDGLFYTQDEVREVVAYARDRGIRVVPEFDVPGHTTSWFAGRPELASAPGPYKPERRYGVFDAAMDPTREETYRFLDRFLGEMAALFPDAYMHVGGDEVTGKHWRLNAQIQAFMAKNNLADKQALQAHFNRRVSQILQKHGKKMVGWDEILHSDLARDTVVQSWRGQKSLADGARQGYAGVLSNGYYLDYLLTAEAHYLNDPLPEGNGLSPDAAARVLGGEACMWGEYVGPETIDSRVWPRTAAIAERLWSPREVRDVEDMYRRLAALSVQLEELGLTHRTNPAKMLRRLAGGETVAPLETLAGALQPKFFEREKVRPITQLTPLTRLVDAAVPDPAPAREFASSVKTLLEDAPRFLDARERVRARLEEWRAVYPPVRVMADRSPLMRDAEPLARDLSELSAAGLEALDYLSAGLAPTNAWREEKLALVERAGKNDSDVGLAVLPSIRLLLVAAAESASLRTTPPAEWKARVMSLAEVKK
ncbi:MAG TPA: family 20 glycosylhydrolase [Pyrinomonadaceae bacterium]|jgi:hexosaminidase|nr:family 20 glycosylhydrolase [Pyrinomonadaceae bacterium]